MKKTNAIVVLLMFLGAVRLAAQSTEPKHGPISSVAGKPELVPLLHHPMDGRIRVRNVGTAPSGPSELTLDCIKLGAPVEMNSCPDLPPSMAATYFDPMFPQNATLQAQRWLRVRSTHTHSCSGMNSLGQAANTDSRQ